MSTLIQKFTPSGDDLKMNLQCYISTPSNELQLIQSALSLMASTTAYSQAVFDVGCPVSSGKDFGGEY
jgi:hypothetical protein